MTDGYNLYRFLSAREPVYDTVLDELRAGRKSSHWIWFIFPQIAGLELATKVSLKHLP
ncbi:MAG: DUF1810 domain-containing protein [Nitrospira sp.]|nr:MAG: DUF1810 domain-containing protein [Nitrospira sp.]